MTTSNPGYQNFGLYSFCEIKSGVHHHVVYPWLIWNIYSSINAQPINQSNGKLFSSLETVDDWSAEVVRFEGSGL